VCVSVTRKPNLKPGQVPLERALSKRGLASRTQAREWILGGRVKVNGVLRKEPLFGVNPERAHFEIDGQAAAAAEFRSYLLYKPRGVITTRADEKNRPTVFSLLPAEAAQGLHAVGRLDWATSGLLILTNDTRLSSWLTEPENGVARVYLVSVRGEVDAETLLKIESGVSEATLLKASGRESHLKLLLRQGKNREIRRLMLAVGHEVTRLKRVSYGGLELGALSPGEYRELDAAELRRVFPEAPLRDNV